MNLQNKIILKIQEEKISVFTIGDLLELGSYENLRKSLERMVKANMIRRLFRGVYDIPQYNETFGMYKYASIVEISKALARKYNWDIYPTGNYALNILGISTQVPANYMFISSGPNRTYVYEDNNIIFKHASLKETKSFSYNTNLVIQALKELGKDNITIDILKNIRNKFTKEEIDNIYKEAINTTIWIYEFIKKMKEE